MSDQGPDARPQGGGSAKVVGFLIAIVVVATIVVVVASNVLGVDVGQFLPSLPKETAKTAEAREPTKTSKPPVAGTVYVPPGTDKPGKSITPKTMKFLRRVAGIYGDTMVVSSSTDGNHVVNSDHWPGNAADFGMYDNGERDDGPKGDRMMRACLIAAGAKGDTEAHAKRGDLFTTTHKVDGLGTYRIQCIWKTENHHDHVHIGARPLD